jgi:glycosyltransferase involved in cell wall biosynthesis
LFKHREWVPAATDIRRWPNWQHRIVFVGNCSNPQHASNRVLTDQGILRRPDLVELLLSGFSSQTLCLRTWDELEEFRRCSTTKPILILDASQAAVFGTEYRELLLRSAFFIAMPGIASVHTHSFAESIACGCCPIVQQAHRIHQKLKDGLNCVAFQGEEQFPNTIRQVLSMTPQEVDEMKFAARSLYEEYFSPEAIGRQAALAIKRRDQILVKQWSIPSAGNLAAS